MEAYPGLDQCPEGQYVDVTFGMLPGGLPKPLPQPNGISSDEERASDEEEASDEEDSSDDQTVQGNNFDGSDIVTIYDGNGDPCQLPREVYEEYRRGGYKFSQ
ncbi:hypothetical protein PG997_003953 [Apiospora hydei]|uniref:Uncharacterized protein n=1 Tax=Apiospora hydei TaxID=1337664 RepID=A0ABR1X0R4_9PEZI